MPGVMQELQEIRTLAREFAQAEVRPHTERWDHERAIDEALFAQVAELGFFGMVVAEDAGGMGFGFSSYVAVLEQLAWGEAGLALQVAQSALAAQLIQQQGSAQQKQQWLQGLAQGSVAACFALAEEHAGSDLDAIETVARRDGDAWILSGRKAWVLNPTRAGLAVVLAKTDDGPALFLAPQDAGWTVGARQQTLGLRTLELAELMLNDVRVPEQARLHQGAARDTAAPNGNLGRLTIAAISVGLAQAALDHAIGYAGQREQFGAALRSFEGIQFKLSGMATQTEAARALLEQAAREDDGKLAAMAKVFASETAMYVSTEAVQIFGGYGYMHDYPVEKLMRDAKAMALLEGANELQRVFIAESLYAR